MPIVDLIIERLSANKKPVQERAVDIRVANNSKILRVEKKKTEGIGETLIVHFEFETRYTPDIGDIIVGGRLVYFEKDLKKLIKEGKGGEIIIRDTKVFQDVQNAILRAGTLEALLLAKEMRMPTPLQLPTVRVGDAKDIEKEAKKGYA